MYSELLRGVRNRCSKRKEKIHSDNAATEILATPVIREMISSEKAYLDFLRLLLNNFLIPAESQHFLTRSEIQIIFGELESIYKINSMLLESLTKEEVTKAFGQFIPCTKAYYRYAEKFERAQQLHQTKLRDDKKYQKFVSTVENEVHMKFDALLIMPIQRIPRYILLLNNLQSGQKAAVIQETVQKLEIVTREIDAHVVESKNATEIMEIENKLDFMKDIMVPGRKLLKSGILYEVDSRARMKRHIWLFSDILVAGKKKMNGRYECCFVYPIRHCEISCNGSNFSFLIKCRDESTMLTADSYGISQSWIVLIEVTISQAKSCRSTLRKESSKQRPWRKKKIFTARMKSQSRRERTSVAERQKSSTLSCLACLGIRRKKRDCAKRSARQQTVRVQKNVPWWVAESTPIGDEM
ncbi:hypothetical protein QR680_001652 [Steinernema hermaphroditum]|uniref:DH domain-containing protein n=1 Tax=Steinernema hermaphroditum TaxID=289476 RepID=A0AA39GZB4_9BILA|nr:hypothetical protein QR680_001652 [Steinernema hermaphroditum]